MIKSPLNEHKTVYTSEITGLISDLANNRIDLRAAYEKALEIRKRIGSELESLATLPNRDPLTIGGEPNGEEYVDKGRNTKDWHIQNAAKVETRGAIVEGLIVDLKKKLNP